MSKLSKDTKQRIVISLTSEFSGKELIDAIESAATGSGDEYALKDLSNIAGTAIPAGVGLNSVSTTSFSVSTSNSVTTGPTGAIDIHTGDINNVASSANTGIMGIRSGETNGSGNTGEVQIYSGNNNGTGSSGNIVISAGTTSDDDKTTGSVEIRSGYPFGNSNSGSINIFSHVAQKRSGDVSLHSGNSTAVGDSGNILIYSGNVTSGIRGSIDLNGQVTSVRVTNYDVTGNHSLFQVSNASPGQIGSIQFLSYAMGNNTMGIRIFDSASTSGFSINGWGRVNENGGPFDFMSTKASPTVDGTLTGGDFNIVSASTQYVDPALGINASVNSGNVNISTANGYITGSNTDANTGNINLTTGNAQGTGTRGSIELNTKNITANVDYYSGLIVRNPSGLSNVNISTTGFGTPDNPEISFAGVASGGVAAIQAFGRLNNNGGTTYLTSTMVYANADGNYNGGNLNLTSGANAALGITAANASVSSGNVNITTSNAFTQGSATDANSGNIVIQTGNKEGAGTRGYISLSGSHINANLAQIKNVADATDANDAVNKSQLDSGISAKVRSGVVDIPNASNIVTVTFSSDIGTSNYSLSYSVLNFADISPLFLDKITIAKSSTGFTVKFSQNTDSINYKLEYVAQLFN